MAGRAGRTKTADAHTNVKKTTKKQKQRPLEGSHTAMKETAVKSKQNKSQSDGSCTANGHIITEAEQNGRPKQTITEAKKQDRPSDDSNTTIKQTVAQTTATKTLSKRPLGASPTAIKKKRKYVFRTYINIPQNQHALWRELCSLPKPDPKIVFKKYKYSITNALRQLQIPHPIWKKKLALFKSLLSSNEEFLHFLARHQLAFSDKLQSRDDLLKIKLVKEVVGAVKQLEQELEQQQLEHGLQLMVSTPIPNTPLRFVYFCSV